MNTNDINQNWVKTSSHACGNKHAIAFLILHLHEKWVWDWAFCSYSDGSEDVDNIHDSDDADSSHGSDDVVWHPRRWYEWERIIDRRWRRVALSFGRAEWDPFQWKFHFWGLQWWWPLCKYDDDDAWWWCMMMMIIRYAKMMIALWWWWWWWWW